MPVSGSCQCCCIPMARDASPPVTARLVEGNLPPHTMVCAGSARLGFGGPAGKQCTAVDHSHTVIDTQFHASRIMRMSLMLYWYSACIIVQAWPQTPGINESTRNVSVPSLGSCCEARDRGSTPVRPACHRHVGCDGAGRAQKGLLWPLHWLEAVVLVLVVCMFLPSLKMLQATRMYVQCGLVTILCYVKHRPCRPELR